MNGTRSPNLSCASCGAAMPEDATACPACGHTTAVLRPNARLVTIGARLIIAFLLLVVLAAVVLWLAI